MIFIKTFILLLIFLGSVKAGKIIAKKYSNRVKELRDMKNALNMFENKIKFTYEDIPTVFKDISKKINGNVGNIFKLIPTPSAAPFKKISKTFFLSFSASLIIIKITIGIAIIEI